MTYPSDDEYVPPDEPGYSAPPPQRQAPERRRPGTAPQRRADIENPVGKAGWVGQGTTIESTRAAMQVVAAVQAAKSLPRDVEACVAVRDAYCKELDLAREAFFSFPRGKINGKVNTVAGSTIVLAKALAGIWGNLDSGWTELARHDKLDDFDDEGYSEVRAYAWDQQSNTNVHRTFIVPHIRFTSAGGRIPLTDPRDIYEAIANQASRRLRECLFDVMPPWFVRRAEALCHETLKSEEDTKPIQERRAAALRAYEDLGVTRGQLQDERGKPVAEWTTMDLVQLGNTLRTIQRGEARISELFDPEEQQGGDVTPNRQGAETQRGAVPPRAPAAAPADEPPPAADPPAEAGPPPDTTPKAEAGPPAQQQGNGRGNGGGQRSGTGGGQRGGQQRRAADPAPEGASEGPRTDRSTTYARGGESDKPDPWSNGGGQGGGKS